MIFRSKAQPSAHRTAAKQSILKAGRDQILAVRPVWTAVRTGLWRTLLYSQTPLKSLYPQASSFISSSSIPQARSFRSSPPPLHGVSTQDLAGAFLHSTTPQEEKRNAVQEEILVQMWRQAETMEELVDLVKEIRGNFLGAI